MTDARVLDRDYRRRPAPGSHVWHWQDYSSWSKVVRELANELLDDDVVEEIRRKRISPDDICIDNLTWLDDIVESVHGSPVECDELMKVRLADHYQLVRAAHGTRAPIGSFYEFGIRQPGPDFAPEEAIRVFGSAGIDESEVRRAIHKFESERTIPRRFVYVTANERVLVELAPHYMIYGSEELLGVAACFREENVSPARKALRDPSRGRPTVFVCDVRTSAIFDRTLLCMASEALTLVCTELLGDEDPTPGECGICIGEPIPAESIVGHYFPTRLCDYHEDGVFRTFDAEGREV